MYSGDSDDELGGLDLRPPPTMMLARQNTEGRIQVEDANLSSISMQVHPDEESSEAVNVLMIGTGSLFFFSLFFSLFPILFFFWI